MIQEIIVLMGYNAAGKSTLVQQFTLRGYHRLNRDLEGGSLDGLAQKADHLIQGGVKTLVLDNTYASVNSRASIIAVGKKHKIPVRCVHLTTSLEDAQLNACLRMMKVCGKIIGPDGFKDVNNPNIFPPVVIYKYKKEFQKPSVAEGFSAVDNAAFIRTWGPEYVNKALVLDYDGTLRLCNDGAKFPTKPSQIKILPKRIEVIRAFKKKGYKILGASNQSGVAKGDFTLDECHACFQATNKLLDNLVDEYQFCPHRVPPITCYCRKPAPGMGAHYIEKYKLNPADCIMVGDVGSDKSFAGRCGFQYVDANEFFK